MFVLEQWSASLLIKIAAIIWTRQDDSKDKTKRFSLP